MTAAAATTTTWKSSQGHTHSHSRSSRPATTPRPHPAVSSIGQTMPPLLPTSPSTRAAQTQTQSRKTIRSPSPSYFGLAVGDGAAQPDSNPGQHTKQNWNYSSSSRSTFAPTTSRHQSNETNPAFDAFRKQSESYGFSLNNNVAGVGRAQMSLAGTPSIRRTDDTPLSPHTRRPGTTRFESTEQDGGKASGGEPSFFDIPKQDSPRVMSPQNLKVEDHQQARLSLPASELRPQLAGLRSVQRSETTPLAVEGDGGPAMVTPGEVARILETHADDVLLLDLRVFPQYAASRVQGALNLCIPTTLLKRPTFTVQKLAETFTSEQDKEDFATWQDCRYIIVYDANSMQAKEAIMPFNVLKKFTTLGWKGKGLVVKGGFLGFSQGAPKLVEKGPRGQDSSSQITSVPAPNQAVLPVAGGCSMPTEESAANPFFSNIRQNMDLLDGVGQMPIKKPENMSDKDDQTLPDWLRKAAAPADQGKDVSNKFLNIERGEQRRMQQALTGNVSYGTPSAEVSNRIQIAGIEKGSKNRYNNIFPFDHSRVKLQGVPFGGCDYVNANYVQASYTNRKYIATQAPVPATFEDFWRVVWEQDVRVIVMLTAEHEGGQVKSHTYWNSGDYGSLKLKRLSERQVSLDRSKNKMKMAPPARPLLGTRRSTQPHTVNEKRAVEEQKPVSSEAPNVIVRHFTLSHSQYPFQPMKEITQLQYTQWPDFGAPASPTAILGLIEQVDKYVAASSGQHSRESGVVATASQHPIVVHCSAGCGRTGTFCTIDSVIDMLKRQKMERRRQDQDAMDVDVADDWVSRDDIDLVAKTVDDFRHQRLSMVQNLRQFVLCYESILQWIVSQDHETTRPKQDTRGRSYQGVMN